LTKITVIFNTKVSNFSMTKTKQPTVYFECWTFGLLDMAYRFKYVLILPWQWQQAVLESFYIEH